MIRACCWRWSCQALPAAAVEGEHGMVVSAQRYASEVRVRILAQGGNAIDAAVAVGYALAASTLSLRQYRRRRVHDHPPRMGRHPSSIFARPPLQRRPPRCISTPPASRSTN
jgi:hypothetical protein